MNTKAYLCSWRYGMAYLLILPLLAACQAGAMSEPVQLSKSTDGGRLIEDRSADLIIFYDPAYKASVLKSIKERGDVIVFEYQKLGGFAIQTTPATKEATRAHYQQIAGVYTVNNDYLNRIDEPRH